jgi:thiamine pyrophosphate-dependent acetolactate synthase large subunit-like protein
MAPTTSDPIVERLLEWGADTYFGLPGDGIIGMSYRDLIGTHFLQYYVFDNACVQQ